MVRDAKVFSAWQAAQLRDGERRDGDQKHERAVLHEGRTARIGEQLAEAGESGRHQLDRIGDGAQQVHQLLADVRHGPDGRN